MPDERVIICQECFRKGYQPHSHLKRNEGSDWWTCPRCGFRYNPDLKRNDADPLAGGQPEPVSAYCTYCDALSVYDSSTDASVGICVTCHRKYKSEPSKTNGLKDSGSRRTFQSGAQRDRGALKGDPSLRPVHALHKLDLHMEKGGVKYVPRNWEKGMPLSEFYKSATRHAEKLLAGYTDEDHEAGWIWNVACFIETRYRISVGLLPAELDDLPKTFAGKEPSF